MSVAVGSLQSPGIGLARERDFRFAFRFALAMLAVNLIGFGPTLFLRPFRDLPAMPAYLYLHGILGTAWFVLVVAQTWLARNRGLRLHRRLGWVGAGLALAILAIGVYTSTNMVPRNAALGATSDADIRLFVFVTAGDLAAFVVFPTLVALGIAMHRRMDVHMRCLLIASLSILGPAIARIASWFGELPNPVVPILMLGFAGALVLHDYRSLSRVHIVSIAGPLAIIGLTLAMRLSGISAALVAARLNAL